MGVNSWLKVAFLSVLSFNSFASIRTNFNPTSQQVVKNAIPGGQVLNSGTAIVMYGAEAVYHLDAGNKFQGGDVIKPTIRPVAEGSTGKVYFPNGAGAAMPNANLPSPTKLKIKPDITIPKAGIAAKLKNFVKFNPGQIAASAAISLAVQGVGWVMSDDNTKVQKKSTEGQVQPTTIHGYKGFNGVGIFPSGEAAFEAFNVIFYASDSRFIDTLTKITSGANGSINVAWNRKHIATNSVQALTQNLVRAGSCAPPLVLTASFICVDPSKAEFAFITDADLGLLEAWASGAASAQNLKDVIGDICNGSLNPAACYQEVEDRSMRHLVGPSSLPGPSLSTTSTYTKTDGTTGTKTADSTTNYTFNYGNNYFDTTTTTTTTTTTDGVISSTETSKDTSPTPEAEPNKDPEEQPKEESYTFTDPALPVITPFYTQKYPNGLSGVWDQAKAGFTNSPFIGFLNSFIPGWGGSCPAWSMSFGIGAMGNYGSIGFGDLCYVFAFVKACMMLGAVFFARSAIFGG
jgi:hypothetical protein